MQLLNKLKMIHRKTNVMSVCNSSVCFQEIGKILENINVAPFWLELSQSKYVCDLFTFFQNKQHIWLFICSRLREQLLLLLIKQNLLTKSLISYIVAACKAKYLGSVCKWDRSKEYKSPETILYT